MLCQRFFLCGRRPKKPGGRREGASLYFRKSESFLQIVGIPRGKSTFTIYGSKLGVRKSNLIPLEKEKKEAQKSKDLNTILSSNL